MTNTFRLCESKNELLCAYRSLVIINLLLSSTVCLYVLSASHQPQQIAAVVYLQIQLMVAAAEPLSPAGCGAE